MALTVTHTRHKSRCVSRQLSVVDCLNIKMDPVDTGNTGDSADISDEEIELDATSNSSLSMPVCQELSDTTDYNVVATCDVTKRFSRIVVKYIGSSLLVMNELQRVSQISNAHGDDAYVGVSNAEDGAANFVITLLSKEITPNVVKGTTTEKNKSAGNGVLHSLVKKRPFIESIRSMLLKNHRGNNNNNNNCDDACTDRSYMKSFERAGVVMPPSVSECAGILVDCISNITDARGHNILIRKSVDVRLVSGLVALSVKAHLPGTIGVRLDSILEVCKRAQKLTSKIQERLEQASSKQTDGCEDSSLKNATYMGGGTEYALTIATSDSSSTLTCESAPCEFQLILTTTLPNVQNEFSL